ncbi:hypothetical protein GCM10027343_13050 [Noviherbaspirillum agri]
MTLRTFHYRPHKALQPYIDRFWGWESSGTDLIVLPTVLPGTGAEFFFHYGTPFRRSTASQTETDIGQAHLLCVRQKPVELAPSTRIGFIAVRFRAGAVHRFIALPGCELLDSTWSAADVWGTAGAALAGRIRDAASTQQRVDLLQSFLFDQLRQHASDPLVEAAIACLYRDSAAMQVDAAAQLLGIGRRQLERRFLALTGQTPVDVRCTSRFQKTIRALLLDASADATDVALAQGYYDQAHFIRDFRAVAAAAPRQWLQAARAKTHFYNTPWRAS